MDKAKMKNELDLFMKRTGSAKKQNATESVPNTEQAVVSDEILLKEILLLLNKEHINLLLNVLGYNSDVGKTLQKKVSELNILNTSKSDGTNHYLIDDLKQTLSDNKNIKVEFFTVLSRFVDRENKKDPEIYNAIGMHRNLWSRLKKSGTRTDKNFILKLTLTLKLDYFEAYYLMNLAGYTFIFSNVTDNIVSFCLQKGIYDPKAVDQLLVENGEMCLYSEK